MKKRKLIIITIIITIMIALIIKMMLSSDKGIVSNGRADLWNIDFNKTQSVRLDGDWEFYWNRLLIPKDFSYENIPKMDSFMKVPGSYHDGVEWQKIYPQKGVATYRLIIDYPTTIKDPALSIRGVTRAYKLYVNGQFIDEVGKVSDKLSDYQADYKIKILDLPKDSQKLELIIQVANLDYIRGGFRESLVFGSKQVLEREKMKSLTIQTLFVGGSFIFGVYYLAIFLLQKKNKTALIFSILCFLITIRSSIFGGMPISFFFTNVSLNTALYINYITAYNLMPIIILLVLSIYPSEYKKRVAPFMIMPNLFFDLLLFTSIQFMSKFYVYFYILMLIQIIYLLWVLIKCVLQGRDNSILMFISIDIFILTIIQDVFYHTGLGGVNFSHMALYGNFMVIMAMAFIQAKLQADRNKKLIILNEKLLEQDELKDKIMATEMSFLQAQIKPHFLYNALSAIANVCEKDGEKGSKLIIDLAMYLRGSLQFNRLDKMETIEKSLEFVDTYFHIEQARFGEKIQLIKEIQIPLDYQIPCLILQPLIENSVRHGITKKVGGGKVCLKITETMEDINIEIQDNGVGIDEEELLMILSENREDKGVGLLNIHNRLLRLYGRGLQITSQVRIGTIVKIVIPKEVKQL